MDTVAVPTEFHEKYPHAVAYEVVGHCMEPVICPGNIVLVDPLAPAEPGRVVVFELPRRTMPMAGICYEVGELVEGYTMDNNTWLCLPDDVIGVVVAVA